MALGFGGAGVVGSARVMLEADSSRLRKGLDDAEGRLKRWSPSVGSLAKAGGLGIAAGVGLGVYALKKSIDAAIEAETVQKRTQAQLRALGIDYSKHAATIDKVIAKQSRLAAVDDEELMTSFTGLVRVTGDVNKALELNGLAADIARAKGIELSSAASIVTKAQLGMVGSLRRQGIEIAAVTTSQDKLRDSGVKYTRAQMDAAKAADVQATKQAAVAALQRTFAGQAEAYGNTAAGAQERLGVAIENVQEVIGSKLLPILTPLLNRFTLWLTKLAESEGFQKAVERGIERIVGAFQRLGSWVVAHQDDFKRIFQVAVREVGNFVEGVRRIKHAFDVVRENIQRFADWFHGTALRMALDFLEPFSKLPREFGQWARDAKRNVQTELDKLNAERASRNVRTFEATLKRLDGTTVNVTVRVRPDLGKPREGQLPKADGIVAMVGDGVASDPAWQAYAMSLFSPMASNPGGLSPMVLDELGIAQSMGLRLTSGLRPGAITSSGRKSLHSVGQAIDVAGSPGAMAGFARAVAGRPGVSEVLYSPVGGWYPGAGWVGLSGAIRAGHFDHVHVGVRGGDGIVGVDGGGPGFPAVGVATGPWGDADGKDPDKTPKLGPPPRGFKDPPRKKKEKASAYRDRVLEARKAYLDEWRAKLENRARALTDTATRKITVDSRDTELRARDLERQASAKEREADRTKDPKAATRLRNEARGLRAKASREREASLRRQGKLYSGLATALRGVASTASSRGLPSLARDLSAQAADAAYEARSRGSDADDQAADAGELDVLEVAPDDELGGDAGAGDSGGFGGGDFGEGSFDGGGSGAPAALTPEQIEAQLRSIRDHRSRFFSSFASDVFTPTAGGLTLGSSPFSTQAGGGRPGVTIVQKFTQPPEDPYVYIRKGYIAAQAAVG